MGILLLRAINSFLQVIIYLILARAIMSWFIRPGDRLYPLYGLVIQITEPILMPFRNLSGRFMGGMVDFSPMIAIFAIYFLQRIIIKLFYVMVI